MLTSPAKTEGDELVDTTGEYVEHIDIKIEDEIKEKMARNTVLPSTGSSESYIEFVEDEISLVPTSVSTFYSPLTEVSEDEGSESRNPAPTININGWGEDWIKLVTPSGGKTKMFVL